jgi:ATP-dependent helicase/nuclease subunit B
MSGATAIPAGSTPILTVGFGPPALGALAGAIRAARADDPLAPLSVVTPTRHVAVSVRRHLARLPPLDPPRPRAGVRGPNIEPGRGLVAVQWLSAAQLAEVVAGPRLALDGRPPLTDLLRRAAVRAALDEVPGRFAALIGNPATERRLDATFVELRDATDDELAALAAHSDHDAELVAMFRAFRRRAGAFTDGRDALERAAAAVAAGEGREAGHVVWYLPERLSRAERGLVGALAGQGALTVLLGRTGDVEADGPMLAIRNQLVADLGAGGAVVARELPAAVSGSVPPPTFVRAPDPDEEVRLVVRRIMTALEQGAAPEDIAIVSRVASPYLVLAHELLDAAGVPHHAPATTSLAQSLAGRTLLGFLRVADRGFRRSELFRWVRGAPVRTAEGRRVSSSYDRIARRAGVAGGVDQWCTRLDRLAADRAAWRARRGGEGDDQRPDHELAAIEGLRSFIDHLAGLAEPPADRSWSATARWLASVLDTLVGGRRVVTAGRGVWSGPEADAFHEVLAVIEALAGLDAIEPGADRGRVLRVLRQELDRPAGSVGTFGHGVFVGRLDELVGARHDLVFVVGMAEGRFPPRAVDDALLPDADRRAVGGSLASRRVDPAAERRAFLAALAAAPHRQLSFARVDTAAQREATPARAFLRELSTVRGRSTAFDELDTVDHPAFVDVPSFVAGAMGASRPMCRQERRVGALLRGRERYHELEDGVDAVRDRVSRRFSRWTGDVGALEGLRFEGERVGSPTSFEQWATCPFRYYLDRVLHVRPYDQHADADSIGGRDRGSLVHEVLERFMAESLDTPPGQPWTAADHARMREHVLEVAARYEEEGRTGRPLLWEAELGRLVRRLEHVLEVDSGARASAGVHPVGIELAFGIDAPDGAPGAPPVAFVTGSGRQVTFRGMIDRVDRDPATGRLVVLDYKTGRDDGYSGIDRDITAAGRHLQLVIYGEAARQHYGGGDVEAYFWFVELGSSAKRVGGPIGAAERNRFGEVIDVIADGIEQGKFPANPGEADYFGFEHCMFCEYNRVCPASRDDQWEGVRLSPRLSRYRALTDGSEASPDAPPGAPTTVLPVSRPAPASGEEGS